MECILAGVAVNYRDVEGVVCAGVGRHDLVLAHKKHGTRKRQRFAYLAREGRHGLLRYGNHHVIRRAQAKRRAERLVPLPAELALLQPRPLHEILHLPLERVHLGEAEFGTALGGMHVNAREVKREASLRVPGQGAVVGCDGHEREQRIRRDVHFATIAEVPLVEVEVAAYLVREKRRHAVRHIVERRQRDLLLLLAVGHAVRVAGVCAHVVRLAGQELEDASVVAVAVIEREAAARDGGMRRDVVAEAILGEKRLSAVANVAVRAEARGQDLVHLSERDLRQKIHGDVASGELLLLHLEIEGGGTVGEADVAHGDAGGKEVWKNRGRVGCRVEHVAVPEVRGTAARGAVPLVAGTVRVAEIGRTHHRRRERDVDHMDQKPVVLC